VPQVAIRLSYEIGVYRYRWNGEGSKSCRSRRVKNFPTDNHERAVDSLIQVNTPAEVLEGTLAERNSVADGRSRRRRQGLRPSRACGVQWGVHAAAARCSPVPANRGGGSLDPVAATTTSSGCWAMDRSLEEEGGCLRRRRASSTVAAAGITHSLGGESGGGGGGAERRRGRR
jgi:hypothetical protein